MLSDRSIFSEKFVRDNKECCTYKLTTILTKLSIGTHDRIGSNMDINVIQTFSIGYEK